MQSIEFRSDVFGHFSEPTIPSAWRERDWTGLEGPGDERAKAEASTKKYAFNAHKSNAIPLRRDVGDRRNGACKALAYPTQLPSVSVIICFINEVIFKMIDLLEP